MPPLKKITILLHEDDPYPRLQYHMIWSLCDVWKDQGLEVEVVKGIERQVDTDLLISHLAMSEVPASYEAYRQQHPCVVNGAVSNITKRSYSRDLVGPGDGYKGPVIIKTNRNYGGQPEFLLRQENLTGRRLGRLRSRWHRFVDYRAQKSLRTARTLCVSQYPIIPSAGDVPSEVFENDALVVERFLPEMDGDLYCLRLYVFMGDRHLNVKAKSTAPIVKGQTIVAREAVSVPEEIVEMRRRLGFDYGKFDYVIHEDRVVLLDANSTPGRPPRFIEGSPTSKPGVLAEGIHTFRR